MTKTELQERWRRNVEEITELAIRYHSPDSARCADQGTLDRGDIANRLASARRSLGEVEDAMRALDAEPTLIGDSA